ncbi:MAG TPA: hypothetical protein VKF63_11110 [Terracidiphilus sp.]|nr:hypothetical protein [Terracidiphilus sp.]
MKISKIASIVGILLCLGSVSLMAQSVRVGGYSLRANGNIAQGFHYTGSCPVDLKFGWGLISTRRTEAIYRFDRSDGGHTTHSERVDIPRANQSVPVYYDWQLGANTPKFADFHGWVNIIIESPNPVQQKINFTIHCR